MRPGAATRSATNPRVRLSDEQTGQTWNPSAYSDPAFDQKVIDLHLERDESKRIQMIRDMTVEMLDKAPYRSSSDSSASSLDYDRAAWLLWAGTTKLGLFLPSRGNVRLQLRRREGAHRNAVTLVAFPDLSLAGHPRISGRP